MNETIYQCPLCKAMLRSYPGNTIDIKNGWTVYCPNKGCSAQEVGGHGKTEKDAYAIVLQRFTGKRNS